MPNPSGLQLRRGFEGPQIVATWDNPDSIDVRLVKRERRYPETSIDPFSVPVYAGDGESIGDICAGHLDLFYYSLFYDDGSGNYVLAENGESHLLAVDNRGLVDWNPKGSVLSATRRTPPNIADIGDTYIVPPRPTDAWLGHEHQIAVYTGIPPSGAFGIDPFGTSPFGGGGGAATGVWTFIDPVPLDLYTAEDTGDAWVFLAWSGFGAPIQEQCWARGYLGYRLHLYRELTDIDRKGDLKTPSVTFLPATNPLLDGEKFHFGDSDETARFTLFRILRIFELILGEIKGLTDYIEQIYDPLNTDLDILPKVGALVGFDDSPQLEPDWRRRLVQWIQQVYPVAGREDIIQLGLRMFLGTELNPTWDFMAERVDYTGSPVPYGGMAQYAFNSGALPATPVPPDPSVYFVQSTLTIWYYDFDTTSWIDTGEDYGLADPDFPNGDPNAWTKDDPYEYVSTVIYPDLVHYRGITVWLGVPIHPVTWAQMTNPVTTDPMVAVHASALTPPLLDPPASPATGDAYIVPSGATGAWSGQTNDVAIWNGASWDFETPSDRDAVFDPNYDGFVIYRDGAPEWVRAIRAQDLALFMWWMKYVLPGTVNIQFLEYEP